MDREDLIGKCGIEREYISDGYVEYFHNNGIIEGAFKKYRNIFSDKNDTRYYLSYELPYFNGEKNGTAIKYNILEEPHIWLEYKDNKLISLGSYFKDRNGNDDYFKFIFKKDIPIELILRNWDISFNLNRINDIIKFQFDKMFFQIIFNNNTLQFYWNERSTIIDMAEFL
jgi:hypothetical protein